MGGETFTGLGELREALRQGRLTAVEAAERSLRLLAAAGADYGAVVDLQPDRALAEARAADRARQRGGAAKPPLLGIPYAVKDLVSARSAVVTRLRRAGGTHVGTLSVESGGAGWARLVHVAARRGDPVALARIEAHDLTENPWDRKRWSGGSSGGSAAAVAAGLVPFAIGTETSGSIAAPAAYCGITGLRPTANTVALRGVATLTRTMDTAGVFARSAADCIEILAMLTEREWRPAGRRPRIGYAPEDFHDAPADIRRTLAEALEDLRPLARDLVPVSLPALDYDAMVATVMAAEGGAAYGALIQDDSNDLGRWLSARQIASLRAAIALPAPAYIAVMDRRAWLRRELASLFARVDLLVAPTVDRTAPAIDLVRDRRDRGGPPRVRRASAIGADRLIAAGNLAGLPGLFLPCGIASNGLPVGIQIVAPRLGEATLAAIGARYQRVTAHHRRVPPGV